MQKCYVVSRVEPIHTDFNPFCWIYSFLYTQKKKIKIFIYSKNIQTSLKLVILFIASDITICQRMHLECIFSFKD